MKSTRRILLAACIATLFTSCTNENGFKKSTGGLSYQIFGESKGTKAKEGDYMKLQVVGRTANDSVFMNTRKMSTPMIVKIVKPKFKPDIMEGLLMLCSGDSAAFLMPVDSIYKHGQLPPHAKSGENIRYDVKVVSILSSDDYQRELAEAAEKAMSVEDLALREYIAKKNLKATKSASGMYYVVDKPGTGKQARPGSKLTMNYTGMLLNGNKFDSNVDPVFGHVQPFTFTLGQGQVIKGWDEGVAYFKEGGKGTLLIPSALGYGEQGQGEKIPPNSTLVFTIELVKVD